MPKVEPDSELLNQIETLFDRCGHNESEVARQLGTTRLRINRVRKAHGAATAAVRNELWRKLRALDNDYQSSVVNDTEDTEAIQRVDDVPAVALQVLRYMTDVLERDRRAGGHRHVQ